MATNIESTGEVSSIPSPFVPKVRHSISSLKFFILSPLTPDIWLLPPKSTGGIPRVPATFVPQFVQKLPAFQEKYTSFIFDSISSLVN